MGKIYFNKKTGEFWESSFRERKPPEGYTYTGYYMDYQYKPRSYVAKSFYCPECKEYHFYIKLHATHWDIPIYEKWYINLTEKYGCSTAEKILHIGLLMGGHDRHYETALQLYKEGLLEKLYDRLDKIKDRKMLRKIVKKILSGEIKDDKDLDAYIISRQF